MLVYKPGTIPSDPDLDQQVVFSKTMEEGCGFGELALIYNDKRSATIQAIDECETYTLEGSLFKNVMIKSNIQTRNDKERFLNSIKLFSKCSFSSNDV